MCYSENNRVKIDLNICCQINACASVCPISAIEFNSERKPIFVKDCEAPCHDCVDVCPSSAISIK